MRSGTRSSPASRATRSSSAGSPSGALIILDNFEHLLDNAPLVSTMLNAASNVTIVATSREPLGLASDDFSPRGRRSGRIGRALSSERSSRVSGLYAQRRG